jgi:ribosomal protein L24
MERKSNKQPKLGIRRGDKVRVIAGDDKGKEGTVLEVPRASAGATSIESSRLRVAQSAALPRPAYSAASG